MISHPRDQIVSSLEKVARTNLTRAFSLFISRYKKIPTGNGEKTQVTPKSLSHKPKLVKLRAVKIQRGDSERRWLQQVDLEHISEIFFFHTNYERPCVALARWLQQQWQVGCQECQGAVQWAEQQEQQSVKAWRRCRVPRDGVGGAGFVDLRVLRKTWLRLGKKLECVYALIKQARSESKLSTTEQCKNVLLCFFKLHFKPSIVKGCQSLIR